MFVYFLNEVIKACEDLGAKDFQYRQTEEESENVGEADSVIDMGPSGFICMLCLSSFLKKLFYFEIILHSEKICS